MGTGNGDREEVEYNLLCVLTGPRATLDDERLETPHISVGEPNTDGSELDDFD